MGLTNFPNGVLATPNLGGDGRNSYAGWWGNDIWYVDDIAGSDSNRGTTPTTGFATVQKAVDNAGPQDTIYIRPRNVTVGAYSDHGYITNLVSNIATGEAVQGLNIIGTGTGRGICANVQTAIAPVAGVTTATILVESPCVNIENVLVKMVSGQTAGCIGAVDSTARSYGLTVNNCSFKNFITADNATKIAAIMLDNNHWTTIENCFFRECYWGINFGSSGGVIEGLYVRNCEFVGAAATWESDIYMGDVKNILIDSCRFAHALPAFPTGTGLHYITMAGSAGTGIISNCNISANSTDQTDNITLAGTVLNSHVFGADTAILE